MKVAEVTREVEVAVEKGEVALVTEKVNSEMARKRVQELEGQLAEVSKGGREGGRE